MKRRRQNLRLVESVKGIDLMRVDQCGEVDETGLAGAAPPVADSDGGADSVRGSFFLSFRFQVEYNARTLNNNQTRPPRSYSSSSAPPSATANADSNHQSQPHKANVSSSASRKRGKHKSHFKASSDPNNVSVSGVTEETLMTKRPRGRPRKNGAPAAEKRGGGPPKISGEVASLATLSTEVRRPEAADRGELNTKHRLLQGKINEAADLLEAAVSAIQELEAIVASDADW